LLPQEGWQARSFFDDGITFSIYASGLRITFSGATQWFLVLRMKSIAQTQITKTHQKPLSEFNNPFQMYERRCAAC
jgi:hypothetical protein